MVYEFRAKWSRFPKHKPPCRGLYLITRQSEGIRIKIPSIKVAELFTKPFVDRAYYIEENSTWMDTRSGRKYGDVIAWMPWPKPCEPLPDDYWHPDQIAARRYMGEEDE